MKTFDCFLFFNELDLLEIRLNILNECVDYFVIVESAITFQGEDKEFIFEKNRTRFAAFEDKIIYFKVEKYLFDFANLPYMVDPQSRDDKILNAIYKHIDACPHFNKQKEFWWGNDFYQRECIRRALAVAKPAQDDLILLSDVDEIPNPETVSKIKADILPTSLVCLRQHEFCYYLNYYHNSDWIGTCAFLYGEFSDASLNGIRFSTKRDEGFSPQIMDDGGWHFTSIGSVEAIQKKIRSWGHQEFNTKLVLNSVEYNIRHGYDIFRRPRFGKLKHLPIDSKFLPPVLIQFRERFERFFGPEIEQQTFSNRLFHSLYYAGGLNMRAIFRVLKRKF
jgi:beta-1,4-mannosyl-glycoprotein beta-1,4-N-acetylglucosaminyltransferase